MQLSFTLQRASERRRDGLHGEVQRSDPRVRPRGRRPARARVPPRTDRSAPPTGSDPTDAAGRLRAWARPGRAEQELFLSLSRVDACMHMHVTERLTFLLPADRSIGIYASRPAGRGTPYVGVGSQAQPVCRCGGFRI